MRLAIIEDSPASGAVLKDYLHGTEYADCLICSSSAADIAGLSAFSPDVVAFRGMPEHCTGRELMCQLHADPGLSEALLLLITASSDDTARRHVDLEGVDGILQPPFTRDRLLESLDGLSAKIVRSQRATFAPTTFHADTVGKSSA